MMSMSGMISIRASAFSGGSLAPSLTGMAAPSVGVDQWLVEWLGRLRVGTSTGAALRQGAAAGEVFEVVAVVFGRFARAVRRG